MFFTAVLAAMVSIVLDMVIRVSASFWTTALVNKYLLGLSNNGMGAQAMQQGGMGLILTTLILTAPPQWLRCSSREHWEASWHIRR